MNNQSNEKGTESTTQESNITLAIASLIIGVAMIIWHDLGGLATSGNPLDYPTKIGWIFWLWSRSFGVLLVIYFLFLIWDEFIKWIGNK